VAALSCLAVLAAVALVPSDAARVIPLLYPQYLQCDNEWRTHQMGQATRPYLLLLFFAQIFLAWCPGAHHIILIK
jgi:hypothetical protein